MEQSPVHPLNQALLALLEETFEEVRGFYLDRHTALFETLAEITAEEASQPVGGKCATLAAQVRHVAFYLDFVIASVNDPHLPPADWGEIWRTTGRVTPEEWQRIRDDLRTSYARIRQFMAAWRDWSDAAAISGALAVVAHSAYHLGEIRQALCTLRP